MGVGPTRPPAPRPSHGVLGGLLESMPGYRLLCTLEAQSHDLLSGIKVSSQSLPVHCTRLFWKHSTVSIVALSLQFPGKWSPRKSLVPEQGEKVLCISALNS